MGRKACLEIDSVTSVRVCLSWVLCCFRQVIYVCVRPPPHPPFFFSRYLHGYLCTRSVRSWCPPSGTHTTCISEYFHLRLHLLECADKFMYIIYTNSGRVKAGRLNAFMEQEARLCKPSSKWGLVELATFPTLTDRHALCCMRTCVSHDHSILLCSWMKKYIYFGHEVINAPNCQILAHALCHFRVTVSGYKSQLRLFHGWRVLIADFLPVFQLQIWKHLHLWKTKKKKKCRPVSVKPGLSIFCVACVWMATGPECTTQLG